jgi:hypothetical protein
VAGVCRFELKTSVAPLALEGSRRGSLMEPNVDIEEIAGLKLVVADKACICFCGAVTFEVRSQIGDRDEQGITLWAFLRRRLVTCTVHFEVGATSERLVALVAGIQSAAMDRRDMTLQSGFGLESLVACVAEKWTVVVSMMRSFVGIEFLYVVERCLAKIASWHGVFRAFRPAGPLSLIPIFCNVVFAIRSLAGATWSFLFTLIGFVAHIQPVALDLPV